MARVGVLVATFRRPRKLARLLTSLLCQTMGSLSVYLGIQERKDLDAPEVIDAMYALRRAGIATEVVEVPLDRGRFVATKNALLAKVREQYAFHTDDDYVFEAEYLERLATCLNERCDLDCVSGKIILTDEIPIDQWGAPELPYEDTFDFCTVDAHGTLHWAPKLQRVDYLPNHGIVKVRALVEQFMFRTDKVCDPLDEYFDQGIFFLNETEWTHREFRCGLVPAVRAYHLRDSQGLSLNRDASFATMNRAAQYFAKKSMGIDIQGVVWKPKFWRNLTWSSQHLNLKLCDRSHEAKVTEGTAVKVLESIVAHNSGTPISAASLRIARLEAFGRWLLARCEGDGWHREVLLEDQDCCPVLVSEGRISWGRAYRFTPTDEQPSSG
jgi:hypothetical protein